jgi:hypothetical protein
MAKIKRIEIDFPCMVELPGGFERSLYELVHTVCAQYEKENPKMVMWVFGYGCKPLTNPFMLGKDEVMECDDEILYLEVSARERHPREGKRKCQET